MLYVGVLPAACGGMCCGLWRRHVACCAGLRGGAVIGALCWLLRCHLGRLVVGLGAAGCTQRLGAGGLHVVLVLVLRVVRCMAVCCSRLQDC